MRIALFHNLSAGGAKRHLYEQARELTARGYELELFAPASAFGEGAEGEYLPLAPLCRRVQRYGTAFAPAVSGAGSAGESAPGLKARLRQMAPLREAFAFAGAVRVERRMDALGQLYRRIAADIDAGGFDLVYVHHCVQMLAPDVLRFLRRTRGVFCCHDTQRTALEWPVETADGYDAVRETPLRRRRRGRLTGPGQRRILEQQERRFVRNVRAADVVLANSWFSREALARCAGVDAHVCYPGVDAVAFQPDPAVRREPVVLSVGALLPNKRHEFVLEAVATIPPAMRPRLEIVGYSGGPDAGRRESALRERAAVTGVHLTVLREADETALRAAYCRASVVAFAPYLEPFGLVALEAMACGTPVVAVSEGGPRETVVHGQTGLLTDRDPVAFGEALSCLASDPERAERMGRCGRARAESEWTWKRSVDRLERIFQETVGQTGAVK